MVLAYGARKLGEVITKEALKEKNLWVLISDTATDMTTGLSKTIWRIRRGKDVPDDQIGNIAASLKSLKQPGKRKFLTPQGTLKPKVGPGGVANPGVNLKFRDLIGNPKAREIMRDRERLGLGTGAVIGAISTALGLSLADSEDFIDFYEVVEEARREFKYTGPRSAMSVTPPDDQMFRRATDRYRRDDPDPGYGYGDSPLDSDIAQEPGFGFGIDQLRLTAEEEAIRDAWMERNANRKVRDDLTDEGFGALEFGRGISSRPSPDLRRRTEDRANAEDMLGRLLGLSR